MLYMATDEPVATIPWDENDRRLNTQDLTDHDAGVVRHFDKPYAKYVGSDEGCGCGFRFVSFQNGEWPEESIIGYERYTGETEQPSHEQLHKFLSELLKTGGRVQLYGYWDGDFSEPSAGSEAIAVSRILDKGFYFRERYAYVVSERGKDCA